METFLSNLLAGISLLTVVPDICIGFPEDLVVPRQVDGLGGQVTSSTSINCRIIIITIRFLLDSNSK
jgi:hypothetical protein